MTNNYFLKKITAIVTKNLGLAVVDNISLGMVSGIKNASDEIKEYAVLYNDALYHMQIRTFLETIDLNQDEVNKFFNDNSDHQRLGIEIFKILESTILEKQSKYIAIAFKKYVRYEIDSRKFHQYLHVINQLNRHIDNEIEQDLENVEKHTLQGLPDKERDVSLMAFISIKISKNQALQNIGFIEEKTESQELLHTGTFEPKLSYFRTKLYLNFYLDIIKE